MLARSSRPLLTLACLVAPLSGCGGGGGKPSARAAAAVTSSSTSAAPSAAIGLATSAAVASSTAPAARVATPASPQRGQVLLAYELRDAEGHAVDVAVERSLDGGRTWAPAARLAGQGDGTRALLTSPSGVAYTFAWDALADAGPTSLAACRLRVTPSDTVAGAPAATGDFAVDNTGLAPGATPAPAPSPAPSAPTVTALGPTLGARGATVRIRGAGLSTAQNDVRFGGVAAQVVSARPDELIVSVPAAASLGTVTVSVVSGGVPAQGAPAFRVLADATIVRVTPPTAAPGETITLEGTDFDTAVNGLVVRFTGGASAFAAAQSTTRATVVVPTGARSGSVWVVTHGATSAAAPFTVATSPAPAPAPAPAPGDDHGDDATSATRVVAGQVTPGAIQRAGDQDWFAVTLQAGQAYELRTAGLQAGMDTVLRLIDTNGTRVLAENDDLPGGLASGLDFTAPAAGTYFLSVRHFLAAAAQGSYTVAARALAAPANAPPRLLSIATPAGAQRDQVAIAYTVQDADADRVAIAAEFRLASSATWRPATRHATSDPVAALTAGPAGTTYRFVWDALADLGAGAAASVVVRLTPSDLQPGAAATTGAFAVTTGPAPAPAPAPAGNTPPVVASVGSPVGAQRGPVAIPCTIQDGQSDPVRLEVHYMVDASIGWVPARIHATSAPVTGVTTSPAGTPHTVVWDSLADLGPVHRPAVIVRVVARDAGGASVGRVTASFAVDNR